MIKKYISAAVTFAALASLATAMPAFADTNNGQNQMDNNRQERNHGLDLEGRGLGMMLGRSMMGRLAVVGTVYAVNGSNITVNSKIGPRMNLDNTASTSTTYVVDASNAVIMKNNATTTVSNILVGDIVAVQGTINGSNIVATKIFDGIRFKDEKDKKDKKSDERDHASSTPIIQGNGQPVIAGKISSMSTSTIAVTTASGIVYTVNVSSAKIALNNSLVSLSSLAVGDKVIVQGSVSGTSINASSVIEQKRLNDNNGDENGDNQNKMHRGFFGSMGNFFAHLFGF